MNIIGVIHTALSLFKNIYGFIVPKSRFDIIYIGGFAAIPLSWLLCKGECLISYTYKKYENNNYQLGDRPFDHSDVSDLFENKKVYNFYSHTTTFLYIGSIIIVNNRSKLVPNTLLYSTIGMLLLYIYFENLRTLFFFQITFGTRLYRIICITYQMWQKRLNE